MAARLLPAQREGTELVPLESWSPYASSLAPGPQPQPKSLLNKHPLAWTAPSFASAGLQGGVMDSAGSGSQEISQLTSHLSCPSSPRRLGPGRAPGHLLPASAGGGGQAAPGLPGAGLGLGRWSSHSISHKYLWGVGCVQRAAGRPAGQRCHGGEGTPTRLGTEAIGPQASMSWRGSRRCWRAI